VRANREALDIRLTHQDLEDLAHEFPTPSRKVPARNALREAATRSLPNHATKASPTQKSGMLQPDSWRATTFCAVQLVLIQSEAQIAASFC
jgi:hypothetical protein